MDIPDLAKYIKRCDVIKKLILNYYPNDKFKFNTNKNTLMFEVVVNKRGNITILYDSTWNEIKRRIDKIISNSDHECSICCETTIKKVTCSKCANFTCGKCYIKQFITGKGIITCSYCRYQIGNELSNFEIMYGIEEIKQKLDMS